MGSGRQISQHLPEPKGSYIPGCTDVMLGYSESGVFMRLYYPTKIKSEKSGRSKWIPWCIEDDYLVGLAISFGYKPLVLRVARWWNSADNLHIPTLYGEKVNTDGKLKCVIFSHGYGGCRFMYSVICNELASRGFLVAALEHRDGSACHTYYYKTKEDATNDLRTSVRTKTENYRNIQYERTNEQVHLRSNECSKVLDFLINLNNGVLPHNIMDDVKGARKTDFKLNDLVGLLDLENITMAGHSFGAATTLLILSKRKEFKQGIVLDPWVYAVKHEKTLIDDLTQPLLCINTSKFHDEASITVLEKFLINGHRQFFTILRSTHISQSDAVCVLGYTSDWFMKKLDPHVALRIYSGLMLRFLKHHTGHDEDIKDFEAWLSEQEAHIASGLPKVQT